MRKLDIGRREALTRQQRPSGAAGLLHEGRDLTVWWIRDEPGPAEPEWRTLNTEDLLYVTHGTVEVALRDQPDDTVVLEAGQCMVVPPNVTFRTQSAASEPAVVLAVTTANLESSDAKSHSFVIRPIGEGDGDDVRTILDQRWAGRTIVTRARIHDATALPGFVARDGDRLLGMITLSVERADCEVVTLDSLVQGRGVGAALLERAESWAREQGCDRLWLVTTNDNMRAVGFYQRRGFRILAIHQDAVTRSRELKPDIPERGQGGIPLVDEIELEKQL